MSSSKFLNFFPTPRFLKFSYVGVELRPDALRYAEIYTNSSGLRLGRFGEKIVPATKSIFENEALKEALKEMRKKEGIEFVKTIFQEEDAYLFTMEVEGDSEQAIRNNIEFHLEENVPISGQDAIFEFYTLPQISNGKKKVLVSVLSRDVVQRYIDFFASCGITVVSFMVESSSLSRSLVPLNDPSVNLLVYLSNQKTVCAIVKDGFVQFSSTIQAGGELITTALEKYYNITEEDAEKMKQERGLLKDEDKEGMFSVLANAVSVVRDEIERVSIYWNTHHGQVENNPIKKVILAGKDSALPGFSDYLSASLKIETALADVWCNIPIYKKDVPPIEHKDSLAFGACLGLSLGNNL